MCASPTPASAARTGRCATGVRSPTPERMRAPGRRWVIATSPATLGLLIFILAFAAWRTRAVALAGDGDRRARRLSGDARQVDRDHAAQARDRDRAPAGGMTLLGAADLVLPAAQHPSVSPGRARAAPRGGARPRSSWPSQIAARRLGQRELRGARLSRPAALPRAGGAADGLRQRVSRPARARAHRRRRASAASGAGRDPLEPPVFALVVLGVVAWAAVRALARLQSRSASRSPCCCALQFSLGVANVAFNLPLALAAAHNAGAAALLVSLVVLNFPSLPSP